jgi:NADPH-dependent stearoyl-CoA 9-desaturase
MEQQALVRADVDPRNLPDDERLRRFGEALDDILRRTRARMGEPDVRHVRRMRRISRACEVAGRGLIHLSFEPLAFGAGVISLWIHKQLEATEIGHTALHGAYDGLAGAEKLASKDFWWEIPIDEESWRYGHNVRHHGNTNIAGRDPDIHFGPVRLNDKTPHGRVHRFQLPFALLVMWPHFTFLMNLHFTGLSDLYFGNGRPERFDVIADKSKQTWLRCHYRALRKYVPYYAKEYLLFPLLAGPFFWKVMLGNWLAATLRDIYSAATIYCGHVGEDVTSYPEGTRAKGRGAWYAMQVEGSHNFEVGLPVSILCGALDRQIEHHLFPKLPPNRLREIAPEVRAACETYGVRYKTDSWPRTLVKALREIGRLSRPTAGERAAAANPLRASEVS